jgi:hypothetical protein
VRRRLDDLLLEEGMLDEAALKQARRHARRSGVVLVRAVVEERLLTDGALAEMLVRRLHLPRVDLAHEPVDDDAIREVPHDFADSHRLLPLTIDRQSKRRVVRVAMADPLDLDAVEEIELSTGCDVEPLIAPVNELADAIQRYYRGVITKMIPRRPLFGQASGPRHTPAVPHLEPSTQPTHQLADEAQVQVQLEALIDLLVQRGVIDRAAWEATVRQLLKTEADD